MGFTIDYNDTMGDGLIPEGTYEVIVKEAGEDTTKNGVNHISIDLVIRNDIKQERQNSHIWAKVWRSKDTGQFSSKMLNTIGRAMNLPNGKQYNNLQALLQDFKGKVCTVKVKHEEYNGYTNVKVISWAVSSHSNCVHAWDIKGAGSKQMPGWGQEVSYSADDLPF